MREIKVGSDFIGVGAFNQALNRLGINYEEVFACDMDKFARQTFIHNYGEPKYYPENVYNREIPKDSLDIYMTSPPCQAFSLAGKRKGKEDDRGILFFNSHKFIQVNKPRFFIFENVKGLLSDDNGRTFQEWVNYLGGKSVNGVPVIFPYEDSVPYHIYWKVLNAKNHGVPQNRERVFIVGIRDDQDNVFSWPKEEPLQKRLKDILEPEVDQKYFLSDQRINTLIKSDRSIGFTDTDKKEISNCIISAYSKIPTDGEYLLSINKGEGVKVIQMNPSTESGGKQPYQQNRIYSTNGITPSLCRDKSDLCIPVLTPDRLNKRQNGRRFKEDGDPSFTVTTQDRHGIFDGYTIRRLTPRECFRLMDFPDSFTWPVSDSQAYKQAGNSIVVKMLELIIQKFNLQ